jgi:hypothetical protein
MGRLIRLRWPRPVTYRSRAFRGAAGFGAFLLVAAGAGATIIKPPSGGNGGPAAVTAVPPVSQRQIIIPDLLVVAPGGLTAADLSGLGRISGVRNLISFDGAQIKAADTPVTVIGVNPVAFRSWVPLGTATDQAFWTSLSQGGFVASPATSSALSLRAGTRYQVTGTARVTLAFGGSASLGISQVDMLVNSQVSRQLGLVRSVAALISAPGVAITALTSRARAVLGPGTQVVSLRQQQLPAASPAGTPSATPSASQAPSSYLQLFQESAADYCPGLSWTVLAAIGQIESGDGANDGPSSAGALGPMQFLPSTWAIWGVDGFGQTGTPDIMNPYDAVPSAARLLCADGATRAGSSSLANAIFDYNHASWYVSEVLTLAGQYSREY